ncbi:MAG: hypothetical protein PHN68_09310 [Prolixibacteraceae bacterium]|nr:hypothetical protein [Prolixibacteraceae bacterium]
MSRQIIIHKVIIVIIGFVITLSTVSCNETLKTNDKIKIIFDTDIGSDCDDAGAMAVLHMLADYDEVEILGVIFSSNANKFGTGTCAAINTYYGRNYLPLGQLQGNTIIGDPGDSYSKYIAKSTYIYGHSVIDSTTEAIIVYIELLKKQPDSSVTLITVGHPVALLYLLKDKEGEKLIKQKVQKWIAMTHTDTVPKMDWNFGRNGCAPFVTELLKSWPTKIYFSGAGEKIITGNKKLPETDSLNPVKKVYQLWGNNALKNGRCSWDQIAVLFAARPHCFNIEEGSLIQTSTFETYWKPDSINEKHFKIVPALTDNELEEIIENLMSESPRIK